MQKSSGPTAYCINRQLALMQIYLFVCKMSKFEIYICKYTKTCLCMYNVYLHLKMYLYGMYVCECK